MTITYRPKRTRAENLAKIITAMGYRVERVKSAADDKPAVEATRYKAPLPDDAPEFFREAFNRAKKNK